MSRALALIVDDEPDIRELLEITLARMDVDTRPAATVKEALQQLHAASYDLCLVDMRLPDGNGIDIVREVVANYPQTPVAVITAHGNMDTAIEALKAGAYDFVSKPVDLPILRRLVETALQLVPDGERRARPRDGELVGDSPPMQQIRRLIGKLARSQAPVFISGESGTGKELAARAIHRRSPRNGAPFVAVNCGAIPQELMESEFFGHVKGSFTGAVRDNPGLFQSAHGGTLFLDEVADLPLSMQVKLLRAIQEKSVRPVGSNSEVDVDVRLISATHKPLAALVERGTFRRDLFYRIHVIELVMPPLRERPEDIAVLVEHILTRFARRTGVPPVRLNDEAAAALGQHGFPGNVRELENVLERATALCEDGQIEVLDLGLTAPPPADAPAAADISIERHGLEAYLTDVERRAIQNALNAAKGNKTAAAKRLGITFRALRYRLDKLGLDADDEATPEAP